jgi:ATP-dependent DNA helicase PIF1
MLEEIRYGKVSKKTADLLEKNKNKTFTNKNILPTKLCTHKDDVDLINKKELDSLKNENFKFKAIDSAEFMHSTKLLNKLCPAPEELVLKVNTQVMLIKNLNVGSNLVNGSRGYVLAFNEQKLPIVKFMNGTEMVVKYDSWSFRINAAGLMATRKQLPLQLAWAISIHKSQGMTLDCVELSLSRVFEFGQAYVALSRAKSLENLRIIDFDVNAIKADETVLKFYQRLNRNQCSE